ncbi:hypothetical protein B0H63DRAFT_154699 [Podospora didyma]|uniref:Uncharacterized protein n=1 Tax=Podospora didyma TaxID=330526 RepID=A0AAE0NT73_9PEZI|nr:hypothetical protein B0H63DRAFT_154699 [Podospora didyma]
MSILLSLRHNYTDSYLQHPESLEVVSSRSKKYSYFRIHECRFTGIFLLTICAAFYDVSVIVWVRLKVNIILRQLILLSVLFLPSPFMS